MKFAEVLNDEKIQEYASHYINYNALKDLLEEIKEKKIEAKYNFMESLDLEYVKVNTFLDLWKSTIISNKNIDWLELINLNSFIFLNMEGFRKIIKKYDKITGEKIGSYWKVKINQNWEKNVIDFATQFCLLKGAIISNKFTGITGQFIRKSKKYWIERKDIAKFISIVSEKLPFCLIDEENQSPWSFIKSVYFDNDTNYVYSQRIRKIGDSKLIRLRWYNDNLERIFLERKIHHDSWTGDESSKDRMLLNQDQLELLLNPCLYNKQYHNNELFTEVMEDVVKYSLKPKLKVEYLRIAFQEPEDNSLRFSLDTGMKISLINYDKNNMESWHDNVNLYEDECIRFSKGIVEIKISKSESDISEEPSWLEQLKNSELLHLENNFSKFLHGYYCLSKDSKIERPEWMNRLDYLGRKSIDRSNRFNNFNINCYPCYSDGDPTVGSVRIEPKVFFANERTFLSWTTMSVFLISIGSGLSSISNNSIGLTMQVGGVIILGYSIYIYYDRDRKLKNRSSFGYSNSISPMLLSIILLTLFIISILNDSFNINTGNNSNRY
jgi:SPX domain protein involved in polyphosphate accumulation/uncharacterized membrane protein YidH (DUF202 family)